MLSMRHGRFANSINPINGFIEKDLTNVKSFNVADNLCEDMKKRKLVNHVVWGILKGYFPAAKEFRENDPVCQICKVKS
jgi:hypothetical protein